jgi:outer membrane usher protein
MVADRGTLAASFLLLSFAAVAQEIPPLPLIAAPVSSSELRLDLIINGHPAGRVIAATALPDGSISVSRDNLESVGIRSAGGGGSALVDLRAAGLSYSYDEPRQSLSFDVSDAQRLPMIYDSRGDRPPVPPPVSSWGALMNYTVFAASSSALSAWAPKVSTANLSGELRLFSPLGSLVQTGIVGNTLNYDLFHFGGNSGLRLDTTYTYADPDTLVMYRAGDVISGGFEWSRPIRLGGVQIQRNFGLRADMVTAAVPSVTGSAAVCCRCLCEWCAPVFAAGRRRSVPHHEPAHVILGCANGSCHP